ncbi:AMP-binding protein, partial [Acinetobacter baumannii]
GLCGAGDLVRRNARVLSKAEALVFGDVRLTWREVNARVNRFAHELRRIGIGRGDRVALYGRNSHQWIEALFAVAKLGAVAVTVN